jgi:CDGSH-type Zn-finger protein/uncharacterized Fe-S cluster protein YjdI
MKTTDRSKRMDKGKVYDFKGASITVHWDQRLCIHVGECGQAEGELFVGGRDPWCVPDGIDPLEVREVCERCPSGALSYTSPNGMSERACETNSVQVTNNGPLYAKGDLAIEGATNDMPGVRYRAALCRCGQSNNKPFCDNSHLSARFEDYGAIGTRGPGVESTGGRLKITPLKDGPLILNGGVVLIAGSGRVAWRGDQAALCRCGASKNKPFCDGSHKAVDFRSE